MPRLRVTGVGSGRKSDKPWRAALLRACLERNSKTKERYLDMIAGRCVQAAMRGDMEAISEIGLRLDGKHIVIEGGDNPVQMISRVERVIVDVAAEEEEILLPREDPSRTH